MPHRRQPLHPDGAVLHAVRRAGRPHGVGGRGAQREQVGPGHHGRAHQPLGQQHAPARARQPQDRGGAHHVWQHRRHDDRALLLDPAPAQQASPLCDPLQGRPRAPRRRRHRRARQPPEGTHQRAGARPLPAAACVRAGPEHQGAGGGGPAPGGEVGGAGRAAQEGAAGRHPGALQGVARQLGQHAADLRPGAPGAGGGVNKRVPWPRALLQPGSPHPLCPGCNHPWCGHCGHDPSPNDMLCRHVDCHPPRGSQDGPLPTTVMRLQEPSC
mmetsp:Transcript_3096/g.7749  ORF Transcript_3096/g.7749 Transcript_3096/m.7749 type:complete len:270 (-) Transcript_3096:943-1752(-)